MSFLSFNEFFKKTCCKDFRTILTESPRSIGDFDSFQHEEANASDMFERIVSDNDNYYKKIDSINYFNRNLDIYKEFDSSLKETSIYAVSKKDKLVVSYLNFKQFNNSGIEMISVYNNNLFHGFVFTFIFEFLLKNYSFVMCGDIHTNKGKNLWKNIIAKGLKENYECYKLKDKNYIKVSNISDVEDVYGYDVSDEKNRLIIYSKIK